jgi:hypothetical protein
MRTSTILGAVGATSMLAAGGLGAAAIAASNSAPPPTKTVTITVGGTGPTGPSGATGSRGATGDTGPAGASGGFDCLTGYNPGILVINHPGGQTKIYTCIIGP